jgi:hypothetical protein
VDEHHHGTAARLAIGNPMTMQDEVTDLEFLGYLLGGNA